MLQIANSKTSIEILQINLQIDLLVKYAIISELNNLFYIQRENALQYIIPAILMSVSEKCFAHFFK